MNFPRISHRLATNHIKKIVAAAILFLPLAGCGGGDPDTVTVQTPTRFVNAIVDVPTPLGVDLVAPANLKQNKIPFGGVTDYANIDTGSQTFTANQSGTTSATLDKTITLDGAKSRTVVAVGVSGATDATTAPHLEALEDSKLPSDLGSNTAVRLVVYAVGLDGPVDLFKKDTTVAGATNVTSGNPTSYALLEEGGELSIHDAITDTDLKLPRLSKANLIGGHAYTILLIGRAKDYPEDTTGLEATVLLDK